MEIFGVGPLEILFILVIALIVLGPNDMVKAGRTIGQWMRRIVTSPTYAIFQKTTRDLRGLPYRLMREAGMEEWEQIRKNLPTTQQILPENTTPPVTINSPDIWEEGLKDWTTPQGPTLAANEPTSQKQAETPPPAESDPS